MTSPRRGVVVWVSRDLRDGCLMFSKDRPIKGPDYWGRDKHFMFETEGGSRRPKHFFGLKPGECRQFRLVEVRKR